MKDRRGKKRRTHIGGQAWEKLVWPRESQGVGLLIICCKASECERRENANFRMRRITPENLAANKERTEDEP